VVRRGRGRSWRQLVVLALTLCGLFVALPAAAQASVWKGGYIQAPDGTRLRYTVILPSAQGRFPVALVYDGYSEGIWPGSSDETAAYLESAGYAVLGVNVRGTGCSGGRFDFRNPVENSDGAAVVEWAARQPWSTGHVGMFGDSFPGLTQPGVAALRPKGLAAIAPFQIIDDVYRDVGYPGGIFNAEFGAFWGLGDQPYSSAPGPVLANVPGQVSAQGFSGTGPDPQCQVNYAGSAVRNPATNIFLEGARHPWFDSYWQAKEVGPAASQIAVPVLGCETWQDDEVGSRPTWSLFPRIRPSLLWLIASNGYHGMCDQSPLVDHELVRFFDRFVKGEDNGFESTPHVQIWHEAHMVTESGASVPAPSWITSFPSWPPPLRAVSLYLHADGMLNRTAPTGAEQPDTYAYPRPSAGTEDGAVAGQHNELWKQPVPPGGAVAWTTPRLTRDVEMLGPASADLWITSTAVDTDLQVTISEVRPDGQETYVARGWLRASDRRLDQRRSTPTDPEHLDTEAAAEPLTPGRPTLVRVELFPFDHVFRAGSSIRVIVDTPSQTGGWNFDVLPLPATNAVLHDARHMSRLVFGLVPHGAAKAPLPACDTLLNQPCRTSTYPVPPGTLSIG
jgi:putative CocE/NonD family hydrolase